MAEGIDPKLVKDPEFNDAIKEVTDLIKSLENLLSKREITLTNVRKMKQDVEDSYNETRKTRIPSTLATATGSTLSIIGYALTPVTAGGSLALSVVGGVMAASGGAYIAYSEMKYYNVSQSTLKQAQNACDIDRNLMKKVEADGKKLACHIESLAKKHNASSDSIYDTIKSKVDVATKVGKVFYNGYKLIDSVADTGRVVYNVATVGKTAALGTRTTLTGLKSLARIARVLVALDAVFIPIDLAVMMKSAYDVHKYNSGEGSNSAVADEIGKLISDLEEEEQKMKEILEELKSLVSC